jgi:hypothetical protein
MMTGEAFPPWCAQEGEDEPEEDYEPSGFHCYSMDASRSSLTHYNIHRRAADGRRVSASWWCSQEGEDEPEEDYEQSGFEAPRSEAAAAEGEWWKDGNRWVSESPTEWATNV